MTATEREDLGRFGHAAGSAEATWDRHLSVGVSHPTDDPARYRRFAVVARCHPDLGWIAALSEENLNDQVRREGLALRVPDRPRPFATAAECLGDAVAMLIRTVDGDAAASASADDSSNNEQGDRA